jgi:hypothetical protein
LAFGNSSPHINVRDQMTNHKNFRYDALLYSGQGPSRACGPQANRELAHGSANY